MTESLSVLLLIGEDAATIEASLAGLAAQTTEFADIVVVDRGSTDGTRQRIERWAAERHRECRFVPIDAGAATGDALAVGAAACEGSYVAVLAGHDAWIDPERSSRLRSFLDRHPDCAGVTDRVLLVPPDGTPWVEPAHLDDIAEHLLVAAEDVASWGAAGRSTTGVWRREALTPGGPAGAGAEGRRGFLPAVTSVHQLRPFRSVAPALLPSRKPLISVLLTSYDHEPYVEESIRSVLDQDVVDLELIVVDDGSHDASPEVIAAIDDRRMRLLPLRENQGGAAALNLALQQARGEYVAVATSDDLWAAGKLARQLAVLESDAEIQAVFTEAHLVRTDGSDFPADESPAYRDVFRQANRSPGRWLRQFFASGNCLCHPSLLARRTLYDRVGFYDNRLRQMPDLEMWIRVCKVARVWVIDDELVRHRRMGSAGNASSPTADNMTRAMHELLWIGRSFFDGMRREDLRDGFGDLMRRPEADSAVELACEQALLLLSAPSLFSSVFQVVGVEKLHGLLRRSDARVVLRERHGVTDLVLHDLAAKARLLYRGFEHRWEPGEVAAADGAEAVGSPPTLGRGWVTSPPLRCPAFSAAADGATGPAAPAPRIDVWAFNYNRRDLLPYFFAHYRRFAQRIVVVDNQSNDGGREWMAAQGVEIRDDANRGRFDDRVLQEQKNSLWKESRGRADWVVVCDVDELVYVSDLARRLAWCVERGVSGVRLVGYNMVSHQPPEHDGQIYDRPEFRIGAPDPLWANKLALFRPDRIDEIDYREGAHQATPSGRGWLYGDDAQFALLHYKFLGGAEGFARRCADCRENLTSGNLERRQSLHFLEGREQIDQRLDGIWRDARVLFPPLY